jgi:pSer/pThr/pTyr-binding forkhead associated (FHA) protein
MKFNLIVVSGTTAGKEIPIRLPEFIIGRDPECHLRPASPMISKKHCSFAINGDKVLFKDYGSTNGSFVNENRVEGEVYLKDGDIVKFGPLVFKAKMESTAVMAAATPTVVPAAESTVIDKMVGAKRSSAVHKVVAGSSQTSSLQTSKKASAAEDDIAAMLFNFADAPSGEISSEQIPMGATVAGLSIDPTTIEQPILTEDEQRASTLKKAADARKAASSANTSSAAEAILQKYMRRPR